jgi:hypothetical protein
LPEGRFDAADRATGQATAPSSGGGLRGKPRGPKSGPLQASRVRETSRKHWRLNPSLIRSELPADVVTTLHVLVEIEVSRREGLMPKATPNLDLIGVTPDDAVLK